MFACLLAGSIGAANVVEALVEQSKSHRSSNPDSAAWYASEALAKSQQLEDAQGMILSLNQLGILALDKSELDNALALYEQSLQLSEGLDDSMGIAQAWGNQAIVLRKQKNTSKALELTLQALAYYQRVGANKELGHMHNGLASLYLSLEEPQQALKHFALARVLQQELGNSKGVARSLYNAGIVYYQLDSVDRSQAMFLEALGLYQQLESSKMVLRTLTNLGVLYSDAGREQEALQTFDQALGHQHALKDFDGALHTMRNKAGLLAELARYPESIQTLELALLQLQAHELNEQAAGVYQQLYLVHKQAGNIERALHWHERFAAEQDSLFDASADRNQRELLEQYETELKQQQITVLEQENALKDQEASNRNLMLALAGLVVLLIAAVALVLYQRVRRARLVLQQQKQLSDGRINSMLREQEAESMNALLEGQQSERERIAHDLHDGLGNKLVTARLFVHQLSEQPGNTTDASRLQHARNLLDDACNDIKSVARELAEEGEGTFNMTDELTRLMHTVGESRSIKTELDLFKVDATIDYGTGRQILKLVQELISNVLKHAQATRLTVQLTREGSQLSLLVEDNGIGFHPEKAQTSGLGLRSIAMRVENLNGTMSIDSTPGKGTTTIVEINQ